MKYVPEKQQHKFCISYMSDRGGMLAFSKVFDIFILASILLAYSCPVSATIIAGTGNSYDFLKGSAAIYRWDETEWTKISPGSGSSFEDHSAVYSLTDYQGGIYAGLDKGDIYIYGGGEQWVETGQGGNEIPRDAKILSLVVYQGSLMAGTRPPGLYQYNVQADRWSEIPINHFEMLGYVAMYPWITPESGLEDLYMGDVYHDMILRFDNQTQQTDKELSILAPTGSCIWDLQDYRGHLYGSSFHGRIYVRRPVTIGTGNGALWDVATPWQRGFAHTWELEVFKDNLYAASDNVLERLITANFKWDDLKFESIYRTDQDFQLSENISALVSAENLYFGTSFGNVFSYDGKNVPTRLGSKLPSLFSLANTTFFTQHPKVYSLSKRFDKTYADADKLRCTINYDMSGQSADWVQLTDKLPQELQFVEASPPPDIIENGEITWNLGKINNVNCSGSISLTLATTPALSKGTEVDTYTYLLDGETVFYIYTDTTLYNVDRFYVNPNSLCTDTNGLSWGRAFTSLSDALNASGKYKIPEIWIAQGEYLLPEKRCDGSTAASFIVPPGTTLYGGFQGNENELTERDVHAYPTTLANNRTSDTNILTIDQKGSVTNWIDTDEMLLDGISIRGPGDNGKGSGIYVANMPGQYMTLKHCTITKCDQGIFLTDGSSVKLSHCTLTDNTTGLSASGKGSILSMNACNFLGNDLAAYLGESCSALLENCVFEDNGIPNSPFDYYMGALAAFCSDLTINDCHFKNNQGRTGGALYMASPFPAEHTLLLISNCHFINNRATSSTDTTDLRPSGYGGALTLLYGTLKIEDCWFVHNKSESSGGAVALLQSEGTVTRCMFVDNQSSIESKGFGGACTVKDSTQAVAFYRSVFLNNKAAYGGGLVTCGNRENPTQITNCTFANNQGLIWAGGAFSITNQNETTSAQGGGLEARNCLFYNNTGQVQGGTGEVYESGLLILDHCAIDGFWARAENIWAETDQNRQALGIIQAPNPASIQTLYSYPFRKNTTLEYHIQLNNSGLIDLGTEINQMEALRDLDGDMPTSQSGWDIGADEFNEASTLQASIQPESLLYHHNSSHALEMFFFFKGAHISTEDPTDRIIVCHQLSASETILVESLRPSMSGLNIDQSDSNGLATGTIKITVTPNLIPDGVYYVKLQSMSNATGTRAISYPFVYCHDD